MRRDEIISRGTCFEIPATIFGIGIVLLAAVLCNGAIPTSAQSPALTPPKVVSAGEALFLSNCAMCHQANRKGSAPEYPSLIGVSARFSDQELTETIEQGLPRMPAFPDLKPDQVAAIIAYLKTPETQQAK